MTTSPNVMLYAAIDGWRRQMVQHGRSLIDQALTLTDQLRESVETLDGLHVLRDEFLHAEASHDLDPLHVVIDVSGLGISGYQAADWLREHAHLDMGLSDHRRIEACRTPVVSHWSGRSERRGWTGRCRRRWRSGVSRRSRTTATRRARSFA